MKKQVLALLMLAAMLLISCASGSSASGQKNNEADTVSNVSGETTVETSGEVTDDLGAYDFEGDEFHMYSRQQDVIMFRGAMEVTEETGDVLNDAIYRRNRHIEERFNFNYKETVNATTDAARTAVLAGDDSIDLISTRCVYAFNYACEGIVIPVSRIPNIDLDKPYWDAKLTKEMTVMNKNYFAVGSFNLTSYDFTHVILINKAMADNYKLDNIYDVIKDGKWTYDKFNEYATAVTNDTNGDGTMDSNDTYGIVSAGKQIPPCFWISANVLSVNKDSDDEPVFNMPSDEKFFDVLEKIYNITRDNNSWMYTSSGNNIPDECLAQFQNGQALFMDCTCYVLQNMRAMEADFGIIPYPKYDENQDKYYSRIEGCELFCVPVTNKNVEMAGTILEAMSYESYRDVIPAYYDIALTTKYTRDNESVEMLDIIYSNRVFDWGDTIWCPDIRDGIFDDMFIADKRDFASEMAKLETTVNKLISDTVAAFNDLG